MKNVVFWDVASCRLELSAQAGSSRVDFLYPKDGDDTSLRNVGYTAPHP
jgi:hypothetical protein